MKKNKTITFIISLFLILTSLNPVIGVQEPQPDWDEINYGVIEHENMPVYGEPFVPDYTNVGYAGVNEVHTMTNEQWQESWERIINYKNNHGGVWPKYVDVSKYHIGINKIHKETYTGMRNRWKKYIKEHKGHEPNRIGIEDTTSLRNSHPSDVGTMQKKLMDAVGTFNSFTEFYNLCKGRKYSFYVHANPHSGYARDAAIKRLKNKEGLNCVDVSQLGYALATEMGYNVKFQEAYCKVDNVGHVLLKVKGKELGSNWVIVDLAACISVSSRAALGHHWCGTPHDPHNNWVE